MSVRGQIDLTDDATLPNPGGYRVHLDLLDVGLRDALTELLEQLGHSVSDFPIKSSTGSPVPDLIIADGRTGDWPDRTPFVPAAASDARRPVRIAVLQAADADGIAAAIDAGADDILFASDDLPTFEGRITFAMRRAELVRSSVEPARGTGEERYREVLGSAMRQARELSLLHEVRTALGRDLELSAIFRRVVEATAATFGYNLVSVYLLEDEQSLVLQHQLGYDSVLERIPVSRGVSGRVAQTGKPVLLEDVAAEPSFLGAIRGIVSEVCVPFFDRGRVAGILNVESTGGVRLGEADLRLMTAVGEHLSLAVERAQLFATARASETRLRLALESADMGTWEWDTTMGEVSWSEQMGPLYGLPPGTPRLTSTEWYTLIHPDDRETLRQADLATIQHAADYEVEFRVIHPHTGEVHWLAGKGRAVERNERGEATRLIGITMDVTSRKRLEQERLRLAHVEAARAEAEEAQRRITDILERITAAFIALDLDWQLTYSNARAAELLGRSRDELVGRGFWDIFPKVVVSEFAERLRQAAGTQEAAEFEALDPSSNRWLEVHAYPSPEGLSIYFQDVTERHRAEEDLRRSEERFRSLVQNASDVIVIVDRSGVVRYASPAMERIIGVPPDEIVGSDNIFRAHPGDVKRLRRAFVRTARTAGVSPPVELRFCHRDGSWRWLEVTATNLLHEPGINGIVANCRDVTERRKAEDDLRFLAETSELLAVSLDTETTLATLVRQVVSRLADWCVVDAVDESGRVRDVAVAHVDPDKERRLLAMRHRRPINLDSPGGPGYVLRIGESRLYPVIDDEAQKLYVDDPAAREEFRDFGFRSAVVVPLIARATTIGVLSFSSAVPGRYGQSDLHLAEDLARRAALAMDNARLYRESQAAIAARDQFLSVAAHELRTPITAINGFGELLRREVHGVAPDPARISRFVGRLVGAGGRLASLVEDMLDVSRIRLGQLPLRLQPVDLSGLVRRVTLAYQEQHGDGRYRFVPDLPLDACVVVADDDRIEQVLSNLLENAVKYTPAGGPVRIAVRAGESAVRLTVSDRGIGLPPDALESIFEPFGRAANATRGNLPGLGLGLFICRNIVERHGGRIWAESRGEGHGTTMTVWLPATASHDSTPPSGE